MFNVYGPRQPADSPYSGVISRFTNAARSSSPITIYGDGSQTRDFVYVKDAARSFVSALTSKLESSTVCNIATGRAISIRALAEYLHAYSPSGSLTIKHGPAQP